MSTDKLRFAPVQTGEDIGQTAALADTIWHDCYAEILTPEQIDYMVQNFQSTKAIAQQIRREGFAYFLVCPAQAEALQLGGAPGAVAPQGETPCGYIGVQVKNGKLLLSKLYLLRRARGAGAGQKCLAFVEEYACGQNCAGVWLTVNRHNARAIASYTRAGYQTVRRQKQDIGGGFVMDDFVMEKALI